MTKNYIETCVLCALLVVGLAGCKCSRTTDGKTGGQETAATFFDGDEAGEAAPVAAEQPNADRGDTARKSAKKKAKYNAMEVPAEMNGTAEIVLKRDGYYVSYNKDRKIPNWVAWHLTAAHTKGNNYRDGVEFSEDRDVPYPRATEGDYYSSRYDRGHMCPSGDNKWDRRAQMQSFLLTNICPQNHALNKGDWNDLEIQCRYWAKTIGDIYIVTGPIFYNGVRNTIGKNKVAVPDAFFKVILDDSRKAKAIGFIYPNQGGHRRMSECVRSVDEIERLTGIDFFHRLDDQVEDRVEGASKETMNQEWKVYKAEKYAHADN